MVVRLVAWTPQNLIDPLRQKRYLFVSFICPPLLASRSLRYLLSYITHIALLLDRYNTTDIQYVSSRRDRFVGDSARRRYYNLQYMCICDMFLLVYCTHECSIK